MNRPLLLFSFFAVAAVALAADPPAPGIERIEPLGELIHEINLPGERRADDVIPGQATCLRLSTDRWLVVCNTRGFRGVDDERSVVYQLRKNGPDGEIIKEGFFARSIDDWDPHNKGVKLVRQHGHVVGYGVPKGSKLPTENLFCVHWRVVGIPYDPVRKQIARTTKEERDETAGVEWVQFRLNDKENDLEIVQPASRLRQVGFFPPGKFCDLDVKVMNQGFVPPVPANYDCKSWYCCNHFDGDRIAVLKIDYDPASRVYRWTKTSELAGGKDTPIFEGNIAEVDGNWFISARSREKGSVWFRTNNPMAGLGKPTRVLDPPSNSPIETYLCADGALRLFTGDPAASPYRLGRDPLYVWDVSPRDFTCTNRRVIFDTVAAKLPFRRESQPKVDFATLFPPQGKTQIVAFRVTVRGNNFGYPGRDDIPPITAEEKAKCGLYYTKIHYSAVRQGWWTLPE